MLTLTGLASCSISYYGQAVFGQMEIWRKQRPTAALTGDTTTPAALKERLELVRELLAFAGDKLLLPPGGNYSAYADLGRDYVVWSVFAAPALDVAPKQWTYPFLGSLDYRGYFSQERAQAYAASLRARGFDAAIAGVPAYSTLGWFRDPLLNTFIDWKDADLAGLIFHELAHKKYYRKGDTAFSEAFAVAVEEEGVRRWLLHREDRAAAERWNARQVRLREFVQRVLDTRRQLDLVYQDPGLTEEQKRTEKRRMLDELQAQLRYLLNRNGESPKDSFWLREGLTNAHLNVVAAYRLRVPEFERLLQTCEGDLGKFYAAVQQLPSSSGQAD